jgi:hypothetical protein
VTHALLFFCFSTSKGIAVKKIELVKKTVVLVISVGVALVVKNAVRATTPLDVKGISKICIKIGTFALAGMISDKVADYTEEQIDDLIESIQETNKEAAAAIMGESEVEYDKGVKVAMGIVKDPKEKS